MKTSKSKFLSIAIVLTMLFALMMPVGAASITINAPANVSLEGKTFELYKVFDVTVNEAKTAYTYTLAAGFENFRFAGLTGLDLVDYISTLDDNLWTTGNTVASEIDGLADAILEHSKSATPIPVNGTFNVADGSYTFSNLDDGYYLVVDTTNVNEENSSASLLMLTTTSENGGNATITLKADAPKIEKKVSDSENGTFVGETDVNIGDKVYFELESAVPNMRGYSSYTYIVHDTMSKGLTFDESSVKVMIGGVPFTATVSWEKDIDNNTIIKINFGDIILETPGDSIVITYSATLNASAAIGEPNSNRVILEYSNDPYDDSKTGETPPVEVNVYTFEIDIFKHDKDNNGLADAEFVLHKGTEDGELVEFMVIGDVYKVVKSGTSGSITTIISNASGNIKVEGLDAGTYYLEETVAPDGYNKLTEDIEVIITHTGGGSYTVSGTKDGVINVLNNSGAIFPETGGIGRTIFYITGGLLVVGTIIAIAVHSKMSAMKKEDDEADAEA